MEGDKREGLCIWGVLEIEESSVSCTNCRVVKEGVIINLELIEKVLYSIISSLRDLFALMVDFE